MSSVGYHEPVEELSDETRDMHRAIVSLMEELEAIDWYQQRADACKDPELRAILAHNRDEEKEHAAMVLEWIRRRDPVLSKETEGLPVHVQADHGRPRARLSRARDPGHGDRLARIRARRADADLGGCDSRACASRPRARGASTRAITRSSRARASRRTSPPRRGTSTTFTRCRRLFYAGTAIAVAAGESGALLVALGWAYVAAARAAQRHPFEFEQGAVAVPGLLRELARAARVLGRRSASRSPGAAAAG